MVYEEWLEKAKDQYNRERFSEALLSAEKAVELDQEAINGWWFAALSHQALGDLDSALNALDRVTDLAPYFANGWARYGAVLQLLNADTYEQYSHHMSVQEAFEQAVECDDEHVSALTALANIYAESDDPDESEQEVKILTQLEQVNGWLTSNPGQDLTMNYMGFSTQPFSQKLLYIKAQWLLFTTDQLSL